MTAWKRRDYAMLHALGAFVGIEAVPTIEESFGVQFSEEEVDAIITVGDMYDLLIQKFPPSDGNTKCASAMTFYRLRRALSDNPQGKKLSPSFELSCFDNVSTKALLKRLEQTTELSLPRALQTRIGDIANSIMLLSFAVVVAGLVSMFFVGSILYAILVGLLSLAVFWAGFALSGRIGRLDQGRLPNNCQTLAGLARQTALLNYGRLAHLGAARGKEEIWKVLTELLSSREGVLANEIARETYFQQD